MTTEPFQHIVVAFDGSTGGEMALERAIELARGWGASLTIVTVYHPPVIWAVGTMPIPEPQADVERGASQEVLRRAVRRAEEGRVPQVKGVFLEGHPAEEILHVLEAEHADLLVMGSRGQSDAKRLLLGSVSDAVTHHAHTAVLVIRPLTAGKSRPKGVTSEGS